MNTKKKPKRYLLSYSNKYGANHEAFEAKGFNPHKISANQIIELAKVCGFDVDSNFDTDNESLEITNLTAKARYNCVKVFKSDLGGK
jgi:AraC-like DNA-binding protein